MQVTNETNCKGQKQTSFFLQINWTVKFYHSMANILNIDNYALQGFSGVVVKRCKILVQYDIVQNVTRILFLVLLMNNLINSLNIRR